MKKIWKLLCWNPEDGSAAVGAISGVLFLGALAVAFVAWLFGAL